MAGCKLAAAALLALALCIAPGGAVRQLQQGGPEPSRGGPEQPPVRAIPAEIPVCGRGAYFNTTEEVCKLCPLGTYNDDATEVVTECEPCSSGGLTCCEGSWRQDQCVKQRPGGGACANATCPAWAVQGVVPLPFETLDCPQGYFKPTAGANYCQACPVGTFTSVEGAVGSCLTCANNTGNCCPGSTFCRALGRLKCGASSTCRARPVRCTPGMTWSSESNSCHPCAFGTTWESQTQTCRDCRTGLATCCEGSIGRDTCVPELEWDARCKFGCPFAFP